MQNFEKSLIEGLRRAVFQLGYPATEITISLAKEEIPSDVYTTIALQLSSQYKRASSYEIAQQIAKIIGENYYVTSVTPERNGFINIVLSQVVFKDYYNSLIDPKPLLKNKPWKFLEVISANPTGYLHIGHTRHGILTDTLGNIFERNGHPVRREYLVNDAGNQIRELIRSFWTLWKQKQFLLDIEDRESNEPISYQGVDMQECVQHLISKYKNIWYIKEVDILGSPLYKEVKEAVVDYFLSHIKELISKYKIQIDFWRYESSFVTDESLSNLMREMEPYISFKSGATWIEITPPNKQEAQKEVLIKSDGSHTYFAQDAIYHNIKLGLIGSRDEIVNILGSDHYGHGDKLLGYIKARGQKEEEQVKIIWMQLVKLLRNGEALTMSKRDSTVIFMKDLEDFMTYEEVRWFFVSQTPTTTLEIDIERLKAKDYNNPVYYVMYAYSRICHILNKVNSSLYQRTDISFDDIDQQERNLFNQLIHFDSMIHNASETYSPHKLPQYLFKLAQQFHAYYETTPILKSSEVLLPQRLALLNAIKLVIKEGLELMRIEAKEEL